MVKFIKNIFFVFILVINTSFADSDYPFSIPEINVSSYALLDVKTGSIIAGKRLDKKVEPASLTKIATLYLVFKSLDSKYISEDEYAIVSKKAWKMPGSRMFVEVGKKVQIKDLIQGVIVQSGNDASVVLAEHIAGSETFFVTMLNKLAKDLGLENTNFQNVTGMPNKEHYTTARDLAILSQRLIQDFPIQYKRFEQKKYTYNDITQYNRNKLLRTYELADGIKTGHTSSAGYCLSASAQLDDTRFVAVIFGAKNSKARFKYAKTLFKFGFRNFTTEKYFKKKQIIARERIWSGEDKYIDIGFDRDIYITKLKYDDKKIIPKINLINKITAPVRINQNLGTIDFIRDNNIIATENIYSLKRVEEGNLYRRAYDIVANFFIED